MLPKEHGAYGQLAFPLLTSFAAAGIAWAAVSMAIAVVALFLAHEPLLIVLGHRGPRALREQGARARWWLIATVATAAVTGVAAVLLAPAALRWTFAVPLVPGAWLLWMAVRGTEKSSGGETSAAVTFASVAVPLCAAAAGSPALGVSVAVPFALLFVTSTLAVRVVILRTRGGGDPAAVRATRRATFLIAIAGSGAMLAAAAGGLLPWGAFVATLPGLGLACGIAAFPPRPARLRRVGWTLVGMSVLTSVILIVLT